MEKQAKSIKWFEMTDVISNVYGETTWTPLWRYDVLETGDSSTIGYEEEILRVRTLFAPLENKERLVRGHFLDFDPDGTYATIDCRNYCKPDVYYFDSNIGLVAGEYPVFGFYLPNLLCLLLNHSSAAVKSSLANSGHILSVKYSSA